MVLLFRALCLLLVQARLSRLFMLVLTLFLMMSLFVFPLFFFFQAEDGMRDLIVTGVHTCALPIYLVGNGLVHEGHWSTLLGLPGWPPAGEEAIVARNILLAELCDHHIHCQHVSAAGSVRLIGEARKRGVKISGEVYPHHIALTDDAIQNFDTNCKMNPPLRSKTDVDAILEGIADGTLSILCSDHAPHAEFEKEVEFDQAPFGIVGLETELGLFIDLLVNKHRKIDIVRLIEMYTVERAKLLKLDAGTLSVGAAADVTLIDPDLEWTVKIDEFQSASRNSPFDGWKLKGRAVRTIVGGKTVWKL